MKKSLLTFKGEDGSGFEITLTPKETTKDIKEFNVTVELIAPEMEKTGTMPFDDQEMHIVMALDNIMKLKSMPEMFDIEFKNFEMSFMGGEEFEKAQTQGIPNMLMGQGGDA